MRKFAPWLPPAATILILGWCAATGRIDFADTYDYLSSARRLWGEADLRFTPKNPLIIGFFALFEAPWRLFGALPASLPPYHLAMFALHASYVAVVALWLRRRVPGIPLAVVVGVTMWNRVFIHYAPFALTDLACALPVALFLLVDDVFPLELSRGRLWRGLLLGICALFKVQTVVIPLVALAWRTVRARAWRHGAVVAAGGIGIFLAGTGVLFSLANGHGVLDGIHEGFVFIQLFAKSAYVFGVSAPPTATIAQLFLALTPAGFVLALYGGIVWQRAGRARLTPALAGSAVYLLLMLISPNKQARYLAQLLPAVAALQCLAIAELLRRRRPLGWVAWAAMALFCVPELARQFDPVVRSDLHAEVSRKIARWSQSQGARFVRRFHAFFPAEHSFHSADAAYYLFDWGSAAFQFHTGRPFVDDERPYAFERDGFPVPDEVESWAPADGTLIVPTSGSAVELENVHELPPLIALRWHPRTGADEGCLKSVRRVCVEKLSVLDGP